MKIRATNLRALRILAILGGQVLALGAGGLLHWWLFSHEGDAVWEALTQYPLLWVVYLLAGLAVAERLFRSLRDFSGKQVEQ